MNYPPYLRGGSKRPLNSTSAVSATSMTRNSNVSRASYGAATDSPGPQAQTGYLREPPFQQQSNATQIPTTTSALRVPPVILERQSQLPLSQNHPQQFGPPLSQYGAPPRYEGAQVTFRNGSISTCPPIRELFMNERVLVQLEATLEARGWVAGIVVAALKAVDTVRNWGYLVRFRVPGTKHEQEGNFPLDRVRSYDM